MLEVDIIFILFYFCSRMSPSSLEIIYSNNQVSKTRQNVKERKKLEMPIISDVIRHPFCVLLLKEHFYLFYLKKFDESYNM